MEKGIVEIYHRGLDIMGDDDVPEGPRVHPFFKRWDGKYCELGNVRGKIRILIGGLRKMSKETQNYLKDIPNPEETVEVDKAKFLKAIEQFKKKHDDTEYHVLDFSDNCIGFKDFVLKKSMV